MVSMLFMFWWQKVANTPSIWTPIEQKKVSVLSEVSLFKWLNCMQATVLEERIECFS